MNWWLVIVAIAISLLTLGLIFYLVMLYQHEDDRNQAWLPKSIVVVGFALACFNVLLLPYDIANRRSTDVQNSVGGGIDTVLCWEIVMYAIAIMTVVVVPFAIFYYEGMDPDQKDICNQLKPAVCYTTITTILFMVLPWYNSTSPSLLLLDAPAVRVLVWSVCSKANCASTVGHLPAPPVTTSQ